MSFDAPFMLALLALIPAAALARRARRGAGCFALAFDSWGSSDPLPKGPLPVRAISKASTFLLYAAAALAAVASAGPRIDTTATRWLARGGAIVFALDCSPSMAALDEGGLSRFQAAVSSIETFVAKRPGDSFALVSIGGEAQLKVPPTPNAKRFLERLGGLAPGQLGDGTALGMGLLVALNHLARHPAKVKLVVLLTDGENNAGAASPIDSARLLRSAGARLAVIGVGKEGEAPIRYVDPLSGKRFEGNYASGFDEASLRAIASAGGGDYYRAGEASLLAEAFSRISEDAGISMRGFRSRVSRPLTASFSLAALACALAARFARRAFLGAL
jgi:Ca-activated chloride channel family protein